MSRKKRLPTKVVNYENLTDELKGLYDKIYTAFDQKNIFTLREEAMEMAVESPTTLSKEDLMKRMTDRIISDYLPQESKTDEPWEVFKDGIKGERVRGMYEDIGGGRIGRVLVPAAVARDAMLRTGDIVEGVVSDLAGGKTLVVINSVEGEVPSKNRKWFADIPVSEKRDFGTLIEGTKASEMLPGLQMGERVIITDMGVEIAKDIIGSFPTSIGLFVGIEPEYESALEQGNFVASFDCTTSETLRITRLALERAKRLCEHGKDVVLVVYGFDFIGDRDTERAIFGAGRCFSNGSLTVIVDVNKDKDEKIFAKISTRIIENK